MKTFSPEGALPSSLKLLRGPGGLKRVSLLMGAIFLAACSDDLTNDPGITGPQLDQTTGPEVQQTNFIPHQFIVVFEPNEGNPRQLAAALTSQHGLSPVHVFEHAIGGFAARFPEAAEGAVLAALSRNPRVRFIQQDRYYYIDGHPNLQNPEPISAILAAPPTPQEVAASAVSGSEIDVLWSDVDGEIEYEVWRSLGSGGPFAMVGSTRKNITAFGDSGLAPETEYCYQLMSVGGKRNAPENSEPSDPACATTQAGGDPPEPGGEDPTNLQAAGVSASQIDLVWEDNKDNETGYEIFRCSGDGCSDLGLLAVTGPFAGSASFSDGDLPAATTFCYQVKGFKNKGKKVEYTEFSDVACGTTQEFGVLTAPDAPSNLEAAAASSSSIRLSWVDNADNEDQFDIQRCTGADCTDFEFRASTGADITSFTDTGLPPSSTYRYRVLARNTAGASTFSNVAEATTATPGSCTDTGNHDLPSQLWGILKIRAHENPDWLGTQNGGSCAMQAWFFGLDTGLDSDHPDLNVAETVDFVGDGSGGEDGHGHGTHTAGTAAAIDGNGGVAGVAPGALVHGFKVCLDGGSCPTSSIIAAIDEVTRRKQANPGQDMVANMSLGGPFYEGSYHSAEQEALWGSILSGVVFAVSAGNGSDGSCRVPADAQGYVPARVGDDDIQAGTPPWSAGDNLKINGMLTVTSSDQNDEDVNCNYGNPVTVAAPGVNILSTYLNGQWAYMSGTSMASPHVAGAAILYLQSHPGASPAQVEAGIMGGLVPWTTNDLPNAQGRLDVSGY